MLFRTSIVSVLAVSGACVAIASGLSQSAPDRAFEGASEGRQVSATIAAAQERRGYGRERSERKNIVETAIEAGSFQTLAAALEAAELVDALSGEGPFTVFAPTDEAFRNLPEGTLDELLKPENKQTLQAILKYHVVSGRVMAESVVETPAVQTLNGQRITINVRGEGVRLNRESRVTSTDIRASNGVIHVIDAVILPNTNDILTTAAEAGSFETLIAAVEAAGLTSVLGGDGPFTVFAPTDDAFRNLPEGTLDDLLRPENRDRLTEILTYHVVPGRVYSDQALEARRAETVQGGMLRIRQRDDAVRVNRAAVVTPDLDTTNGVIHVIDTVLIPE